MLRGNQWSHIKAASGADTQLLDLGHKRIHQRVGHGIADCHNHRNSHAALATGAKGRTHDGIHSRVQIRIRHDHRMVLGSAERLHPLAVRSARAIDVLGNGCGTDEAHCLHARICQQCIDRALVAIDDIEYTGRNASLDGQTRQNQ